MQTSESGMYIEFVKRLLDLVEELRRLGDFIINRKHSIKNRRLGDFEASWHMRFNHGCKSRILRATTWRSYLPYTRFPREKHEARIPRPNLVRELHANLKMSELKTGRVTVHHCMRNYNNSHSTRFNQLRAPARSPRYVLPQAVVITDYLLRSPVSHFFSSNYRVSFSCPVLDRQFLTL